MIQVHTIGSGSSGNAHLLTDRDAAPLLLECGLPWKVIQAASGHQTAHLAGCAVSHGHSDHAQGVMGALSQAVDCYLSREVMDAMGLGNLRRAHELAAFQRIGEWFVRAFPVDHDSPGAVGFFVAGPSGEKLLYTGETPFCRVCFAPAEVMMVEANYSTETLRAAEESGAIDAAQAHRIRRAHMSLEAALRLLEANDLSRTREIILCHLSDRHADAGAFADVVRRATGVPVSVAAAYRRPGTIATSQEVQWATRSY